MADNAVATATDSRLASFKNLAATPVARQLTLMAGIAAAVAIGVAMVMWSRTPDYGMLYAGLEQRDAAAVTQALQAANEPYKLGTDGASVFVPAADVSAMRLKLASQACNRSRARACTWRCPSLRPSSATITRRVRRWWWPCIRAARLMPARYRPWCTWCLRRCQALTHAMSR